MKESTDGCVMFQTHGGGTSVEQQRSNAWNAAAQQQRLHVCSRRRSGAFESTLQMETGLHKVSSDWLLPSIVTGQRSMRALQGIMGNMGRLRADCLSGGLY